MDLSYMLDPTGPFANGPEGYNDSPTRMQQLRNGSIYDILKSQEKAMEAAQTTSGPDQGAPTGQQNLPVSIGNPTQMMYQALLGKSMLGSGQ